MKKDLENLKACEDGIVWAEDKEWGDIHQSCNRGDWGLWFFKKTNPDDVELLTFVKGHCANTVRHLMTDQRSLNAVDTAIAFGEGKATLEELIEACDSAHQAAEDIAEKIEQEDLENIVLSCTDGCEEIEKTNNASYSAAYAAYAAADLSSDGAAAAAYASEASENKEKNLKMTAEICRKYLPINIWKV